MGIVWLADNLYGMSNLIFSEKITINFRMTSATNSLRALRVKIYLTKSYMDIISHGSVTHLKNKI